MSKAVLIIDKPESCLACEIGQDEGDYYIWCPIERKMAEYTKKRPEWCPLMEVEEYGKV